MYQKDTRFGGGSLAARPRLFHVYRLPTRGVISQSHRLPSNRNRRVTLQILRVAGRIEVSVGKWRRKVPTFTVPDLHHASSSPTSVLSAFVPSSSLEEGIQRLSLIRCGGIPQTCRLVPPWSDMPLPEPTQDQERDIRNLAPGTVLLHSHLRNTVKFNH